MLPRARRRAALLLERLLQRSQLPPLPQPLLLALGARGGLEARELRSSSDT